MTTPDDNKFESMAKGVEFTEGCTVDPNSMTNTTPILELWELSDNGKAEWWPDNIDIDTSQHRYCLMIKIHYTWHRLEFVAATDGEKRWHRHTRDIVRSSAETWLRGKGWDIYRYSHESFSRYRMSALHTNRDHYRSLPDAIRAEIGRGK